jgi:hypothetical protein
VAQLRDAHEAISARGVRLVVIGNGAPYQARAFREEEGIPFDLWVDPDMTAYAAAGLHRSMGKTLSHRSLGHAWRAWKTGARQSKVQGDPWQLGGAFLITPEGKALFTHVSSEAGDHPSPVQFLAAMDRL